MEYWTECVQGLISNFNPLGYTTERQIKTSKILSWESKKESRDDFSHRLKQLADLLGYDDDHELITIKLCMLPAVNPSIVD